jgi:hypothetical protein
MPRILTAAEGGLSINVWRPSPPAIVRGMKPRFQISVRDAMLIVALLTVWLAVVTYTHRASSDEFIIPLNWPAWRSLVIGLPACVIGVLFKKVWLGALCGATSAASFYAWELLMRAALESAMNS